MARQRKEEGGPPPREGAVPADAESPEVDQEEQELRVRMAELGFVPVDPSALEKGEPLSQEDWQALFRYHRDPGSMTEAERLRIIRLSRRVDTWHQADLEVLIQTTKEIGFGNKHQN